MDADSLAERIIKDLDLVFNKNPTITEFDILPIEVCVTNKCPVIHVSYHVGLESWCIKHVFQYAYRKIIELRTIRKPTDLDLLLSWTRALLLINPDIQFAWNIRKELLDLDKMDINKEIQFSSVVLSRKHKCSEVFIHRRWLLAKLLLKNHCNKISCEQTLIELHLCSKAAESYPQNYYAWSHRIWVVQRSQFDVLELISLELESSEAFCSKHVSDHSGLHYRQFLLKLWLDQSLQSWPIVIQEREKFRQELFRELSTNSEMLQFYQGRESLWYHRRFILQTLAYVNVQVPKKVSNQIVKRKKTERARDDGEFANSETEFLAAIKLKCSSGDKQAYLLEKHDRWMHKFLLAPLGGGGVLVKEK